MAKHLRKGRPPNMSTSTQIPDSLGANPLCIAVISPNAAGRSAAISALNRFPNGRIREYVTYPPGIDAIAQVLKEDFDVVIIDLDSDPEYALELVENICADGSTSVIVYSANANQDLLVRCMRAGAREFLPMPIASDAMAAALVRVSARRTEGSTQKEAKRGFVPRARGKLLCFLSAKGGSGVTTLACGLAVSLAQDFGQRTLLIDLNFPLGDAALNLGINSQYTTTNALENPDRLDASFLASLLVEHDSGLFVLAAPSELSRVKIANDALFKLLRVAHHEFDYVVVDAGSRLDIQEAYRFDESTTIYLVTQIGLPELRNSNRLIKRLLTEGGNKLEIVVNRYSAGSEGLDEGHINKALTQPARWKIPNDYSAVRRMQNSATSLTGDNSHIARAIREMAESVCGQPAPRKKKKGFGLF
ncbi:MAG TPA: AAA family ATPase [Terracidiphilus sp.]|nr:AAA family ATPase [Terracidiphilus sp.]